MSEQDVRAATDAGTSACEQRQSHYQENIAGQAAAAGDPAMEEPSLQPIPAPTMQSTV